MTTAFQRLLVSYRHRACLSQLHLGIESGLSPGYISRLESGSRTGPSRAVLAALVATLGLDAPDAAALYLTLGLVPDGGSMSTTHDPRLREALIVLKRLEAERDALLAERERDRQTIQGLEYHLHRISGSAKRMRRAQAVTSKLAAS